MASTLLTGSTAHLRALRVGDLERLRGWRRDPGFVCSSAALAWPPTDDRLEAMVRPADALRTFAIEPAGPAGQGEAVGWCALLNLDWKNRHVGLAWGFTAGADPGLVSEALAVLLSFTFLELNLERVEAEVYAGGTEAPDTLRGLGLTLEAVKREAARQPGAPAGLFADVALWAVLRNEWAGR